MRFAERSGSEGVVAVRARRRRAGNAAKRGSVAARVFGERGLRGGGRGARERLRGARGRLTACRERERLEVDGPCVKVAVEGWRGGHCRTCAGRRRGGGHRAARTTRARACARARTLDPLAVHAVLELGVARLEACLRLGLARDAAREDLVREGEVRAHLGDPGPRHV